MDITQVVARLKAPRTDSIVKRLAVPMEVGFMFPMGELKAYLLLHDFNHTLTKTGGFLTRDYVLVVTNEPAQKVLQLVNFVYSLVEEGL